MSEEAKAVARRITEELWNAGNLDAMDELLAPDFVDHHPRAPEGGGRDGYRAGLGAVRRAFPDLETVDDDLIAEGDRVVSRWTSRGTHRGEWMGIAPTGREVIVRGVNIWRIEGGRAVERWNSYDALAVLEQLGRDPLG